MILWIFLLAALWVSGVVSVGAGVGWCGLVWVYGSLIGSVALCGLFMALWCSRSSDRSNGSLWLSDGLTVWGVVWWWCCGSLCGSLWVALGVWWSVGGLWVCLGVCVALVWSGCGGRCSALVLVCVWVWCVGHRKRRD